MEIKHVTDQNIDDVIKNATTPVILDLWAPWCGPCVAMGEVFEDVSSDRDDVLIIKLNVDDNPETTAKFGVRSIPTLILFKDGNQVDKHIGTMSENDLNSFINKAL